MSVEDVELVLSLQLDQGADAAVLASDDAGTAGYLASIADAFDPAFECTMQFPDLNPVTYRKRVDALHGAWLDRLKHWAGYRAEIEGVIDAEPRVIVFHRAYVRHSPDATESVLEVASIWTLRDHRLIRAEFNVPQPEARAIADRIS